MKMVGTGILLFQGDLSFLKKPFEPIQNTSTKSVLPCAVCRPYYWQITLSLEGVPKTQCTWTRNENVRCIPDQPNYMTRRRKQTSGPIRKDVGLRGGISPVASVPTAHDLPLHSDPAPSATRWPLRYRHH